jgi:D-alanyl-D-alanine carboxypeptidase
MADDPASLEPDERELEADPRPAGSWLRQNRALALGLGCVGLCGVIAIDVYLMVKSDAKRSALAVAKSAEAASAIPPPAVPAAQTAPSGAPSEPGEDTGEALDYESDDGEPHPGKTPAAPKHFDTVQHAALDSCTTASVDGLSRQIIAQARCIRPNAFVPLPSRPNLVVASQVFPYLELEARDHLLKAVDAHPKAKMTINSALRTVAQQYLVWRWSATKRCGVPLATPPGESNHEVGFALDIAEAASWRPALEAQDFKWLGASDRVHFDYKSSSSAGRVATDVLAFQKLWNKNNPSDKVAEDGHYTVATEQRLKQAPADGFKLGPSCSKPAPK